MDFENYKTFCCLLSNKMKVYRLITNNNYGTSRHNNIIEKVKFKISY